MSIFLEFLTLGVSAFIAWCAFQALGTWRSQIKANRITKFLDEVNEATFDFVVKVQRPIDAHKHLRLRVWAHCTNLPESNMEITEADVIRYYEDSTTGFHDEFGKLLQKSLEESAEVNSTLTALLYRGQIHDLKEYRLLIYQIQRMQWQHNRLDSFFTLITRKHLSPSNPKVRRMFQRVAEIDDGMMLAQLNHDYKKVVKLLKGEYDQILK
jgi:hypothetical protein